MTHFVLSEALNLVAMPPVPLGRRRRQAVADRAAALKSCRSVLLVGSVKPRRRRDALILMAAIRTRSARS